MPASFQIPGVWTCCRFYWCDRHAGSHILINIHYILICCCAFQVRIPHGKNVIRNNYTKTTRHISLRISSSSNMIFAYMAQIMQMVCKHFNNRSNYSLFSLTPRVAFPLAPKTLCWTAPSVLVWRGPLLALLRFAAVFWASAVLSLVQGGNVAGAGGPLQSIVREIFVGHRLWEQVPSRSFQFKKKEFNPQTILTWGMGLFIDIENVFKRQPMDFWGLWSWHTHDIASNILPLLPSLLLLHMGRLSGCSSWLVGFRWGYSNFNRFFHNPFGHGIPWYLLSTTTDPTWPEDTVHKHKCHQHIQENLYSDSFPTQPSWGIGHLSNSLSTFLGSKQRIPVSQPLRPKVSLLLAWQCHRWPSGPPPGFKSRETYVTHLIFWWKNVASWNWDVKVIRFLDLNDSDSCIIT